MITAKDRRLFAIDQIMSVIEEQASGVVNSSNDVVKLELVDSGYRFTRTDMNIVHYTASLRRALQDTKLVVEFNIDGKGFDNFPAVIYVEDYTKPEAIAQAIINWFDVWDGHLFEVPANGELPAYNVVRVGGGTYLRRGKPVKFGGGA